MKTQPKIRFDNISFGEASGSSVLQKFTGTEID
jgi:hypothetical protein